MKRRCPSMAALLAVICLTHGCMSGDKENDGIIVCEASGIARIDHTLLIVGDDADGRYFVLPLRERSGPIIPIDPEIVEEVVMPHAELAMDLEAIDELADGRVAVLSEQLHCLISRSTLDADRYGVIAEYDKSVIEFDNRGLEGLAVKALPDGTSRIAVLWEGGYPIYGMTPTQLQQLVGRHPLKPIVIVHEIEKGRIAGFVDEPLQYLQLNVPEPEGQPPLAQRFRATDLVWYQKKRDDVTKDTEDGFIVLLSSEDSPPDSTGLPTSYLIKILQRFDLNGNPIGESVDINDICRTALKKLTRENPTHISHRMMTHLEEVTAILDKGNWENINWEGLDWFEPGVSLITIYDKWPKDPPFALIIDIPEEWK